MRSLLIYLKDYKKETILAPLFKMLEASFELLVPLVMAAVIDVGIAGQDRPYIVKMCLVLIALGIIGAPLLHSIFRQRRRPASAPGSGTRCLSISRTLLSQKWMPSGVPRLSRG